MTIKHSFFAVLVAFLWGLNFIIAKVGLQEIPQFLFSFLRYFLTAVPLLFFLPRPKNNWPILIAIGLTHGFLSFMCTLKGINLGVPGGLVSLIFQLQTVFTVALGYFILRITPTRNQTIGLTIAVFGMLCVAISINDTLIPYFGFAIIIIAALFWAFGNILTKQAGSINCLHLIVWSSLFAAAGHLLVSLTVEGPTLILSSLQNLTWKGYGSILYIVVATTLLGGSLQTHLIKTYSPTHIAPYSLLIPIAGLLSGWILLDEHMSFETLIGSGIIFIGLIINQWPKTLSLTIITEAKPQPTAVQKAA